MSRATPLPPDERRAAIIEAALPLLEEHGPALTTRMVAEAAGIAEGTLYRVFGSLDELVAATIAEFLSPERLATRLAAAPLREPLEERLRDILAALVAYFDHVNGTLRPGPGHRPAPGKTNHKHMAEGHRTYTQRLSDLKNWVDMALAPYEDQLAIPTRRFAHFLMNLAIGHVMGRPADVGLDDVAHFALHGARNEEQA